MGVSVTLVRLLVEEVLRVGADPDAYLRDAGVEPSLLEDANARIDHVTYDTLQERALDLTKDPALGLHMGERANLAAFHFVGLLSLHSCTLRQALEVFTRYRSLLSDCEAPALEERGDEAILTCEYVRGSARCNRLRAELNVTSLVRIAHAHLGVREAPRAVELEHAAPAYVAEYTRVLRCPVRFEAGATRLRFPRRLLDATQLHKNDEVFRLLADRADRLLETLAPEPKVTARVRSVLREREALLHLGGPRPSMTDVAAHLGVSPRSLRRRLRAEGCSYADLVESSLASVAQELVGESDVRIDDVAERLGFSEPSAFYRAFKRWTGLTPRQYRAQRVSA